jgi:hypothetical protein
MDLSRDHMLVDTGIAFLDRVTVAALSDSTEPMVTLQRFLRRLGASK